MGGGRWEVGGGRWEVGGGRWEVEGEGKMSVKLLGCGACCLLIFLCFVSSCSVSSDYLSTA